MGRQQELKAKNNPLTPKQFSFLLESTTGGSLTLKYAPDGWENDEYVMTRDMAYFGVFRKFAVAEMKFVKDGRDYLRDVYEADGVNADVTFTVTELPPSGTSRTRFIGKIDFSTYKITELSVDVQVIDGAFTDLLLSRAKTEVNLLGTKSLDGDDLFAPVMTDVTIPEINIVEVASWEAKDTTEVMTESHSLQVNLLASEFEEARSTAGLIGGKFFIDAVQDYTVDFTFHIRAKANGSGHFTWLFHLDRWADGEIVEADVWSDSYESTGHFPMTIDTEEVTVTLEILEGDSFRFWAELVVDYGAGNIQYEQIDFGFDSLIETIPQRSISALLYHEVFDLLVAQYVGGLTGRVKSNFLGRTDIGYAEDGPALGALTKGKYIRSKYWINPSLPITLDAYFRSLQAIYCLGMGVETIANQEKLVIEPMIHFFSAEIVLDLSSRIAPETIQKQVAPELMYNRITAGYGSYDYDRLGGIYEYNTFNKYTTAIKPVDKVLEIVSPYRGDISGVIALEKEPVENRDVQGEDDIFILDTIRDGQFYIVRTSEGFDVNADATNRDILFNVAITPGRNVRRWGSYIRSFLEHYSDTSLLWQTSDKNTKLRSTETGQTTIIENADIPVDDLSDPLWHPEVFTLEVPALETDIDAIKLNPYGLIKITEDEYGWLLNYRSKNENRKSEFKLLRCNTTYVTPITPIV